MFIRLYRKITIEKLHYRYKMRIDITENYPACKKKEKRKLSRKKYENVMRAEMSIAVYIRLFYIS